jgi:hypothetical protein
MAMQLFPVTNEAGIGAETITYEQYDSHGMVKFITDYADDLPKSDVKGKQFSIIIQSLAGPTVGACRKFVQLQWLKEILLLLEQVLLVDQMILWSIKLPGLQMVLHNGQD